MNDRGVSLLLGAADGAARWLVEADSRTRALMAPRLGLALPVSHAFERSKVISQV